MNYEDHKEILSRIYNINFELYNKYLVFRLEKSNHNFFDECYQNFNIKNRIMILTSKMYISESFNILEVNNIKKKELKYMNKSKKIINNKFKKYKKIFKKNMIKSKNLIMSIDRNNFNDQYCIINFKIIYIKPKKFYRKHKILLPKNIKKELHYKMKYEK